MGRISFFSLLTDNNMSLGERSAINSASDRADDGMDVARAQGDAFGQAISSMQRTIRAQDKQIKLLHAAIGVLAMTLRDNNVVDGDILDARLEAAILNAEDEYSAEVSTSTCLKCSRQVPNAQTVMTEIGLVCDRCHALG